MIVLLDRRRRHLPALVLTALAALALSTAPAGSARAQSAPTAISTPAPEFPEHARRTRKSGYVLVTFTIGTDGRVGNVRILESSPPGVFDRAVESALARWRYEPPATPREITHTFYFDQ